MLWCLAIVAAAVSAVEGQILSYDGTTFVNDDAQPAAVVQTSSSARVPAFGQSFTFIPAPAAASVQPVVVAQQPTFLPPPQPSFIHVTAPVGGQFSGSQASLPVLPACHSTSLVHFTYGGSFYHFSWCHFGQRFTHQQAADYCRSHSGFDVVRIEDEAELDLIYYLLTYYAQASVWTRDTGSTAPYSIRSFILGSGANIPGHDCLSMENGLGCALLANACSAFKAAICEAHY